MPLNAPRYCLPPNASPLPFDTASSDGLSDFHMAPLSVDWANGTGLSPREPLRSAICLATAFDISNPCYDEPLRFSCPSDEEDFEVAPTLIKYPTLRGYHDAHLVCDADNDNLVNSNLCAKYPYFNVASIGCTDHGQPLRFAEEADEDPFRIAVPGPEQYSADDTSDGPSIPRPNVVLRRTAFNRPHLNKKILMHKPIRRTSRRKGNPIIKRSISSYRHAHYYSTHRAIQAVKDGYDADAESEDSSNLWDKDTQRVDHQGRVGSSKPGKPIKHSSNFEFEVEDEGASQIATTLDSAMFRVSEGSTQRSSQQLSHFQVSSVKFPCLLFGH